jgi:hypothetical protein
MHLSFAIAATVLYHDVLSQWWVLGFHMFQPFSGEKNQA